MVFGPNHSSKEHGDFQGVVVFGSAGVVVFFEKEGSSVARTRLLKLNGPFKGVPLSVGSRAAMGRGDLHTLYDDGKKRYFSPQRGE